VEGDAPGRTVREGPTSSTMGPQAPVRGAGATAAPPGAGSCWPVSPRRRWIGSHPRGRPVSLATPTAGSGNIAGPSPRSTEKDPVVVAIDSPDRGPRSSRRLPDERGLFAKIADAVGQQHEHPQRLDPHTVDAGGAGHVLLNYPASPCWGSEEGTRHRGPVARSPGRDHRGGAHADRGRKVRP